MATGDTASTNKLHQDNYGRVKETHAHTQALWEKEIRRARKENFKAQSNIVKLQEELKTARTAAKINEECLAREKERSHAREQEAFAARYNIVGVQEQLEQALHRIKVIEQERDAFKTAAKNEEVARIAAEGRLPLPTADDSDDFASSANKKLKKRKRDSVKEGGRVSLSAMEILSSAASELEIEELSVQVRWERQRADRAQEMIEFLQAECQMHCCPCSKDKAKDETPKPRRASPPKIMQSVEQVSSAATKLEHDDIPELVDDRSPVLNSLEGDETPELEASVVGSIRSRKQRTSTIFVPQEGVFRTVSEQEAAAYEAQMAAVPEHDDLDNDMLAPESPQLRRSHREFARTPSVEPPSCAMMPRDRDSLQSLLSAPHGDDDTASSAKPLNIPTVADEPQLPMLMQSIERRPISEPEISDPETYDPNMSEPDISDPEPEPEVQQRNYNIQATNSPQVALNSSSRYQVTTTTVPVRTEEEQRRSSFNDKLRTPSSCSNRSFDHNDPALTPTMTREQALAKIQERRRARSGDRSTAASRAKQAQAIARRDASGGSKAAPGTTRTVSRTRSRNLVR